MARRLILAATVIFLADLPWLQIVIWIGTSMSTLAYQLTAKPYSSKLYAFFEFWNEATILLISYVVIPLAMTESSDLRPILGKVLIAIVFTTVIMNFVNLAITMALDIYTRLKKIYFKVKALYLKLRKSKKNDVVKMIPTESQNELV